MRVTVSGSFNQFLEEVGVAVEEFRSRGVYVLSPASPKVVAQREGFLFVASDPTRCIREVQDHHLQAIATSDLLWLVAPGGYLGCSASMEIGFAVARGIPIFSATEPEDVTLKRYVRVVTTIEELLSMGSLR